MSGKNQKVTPPEEVKKPKTIAEKKQYYINVMKNDRDQIVAMQQKIKELEINIHRVEGALIMLNEFEAEMGGGKKKEETTLKKVEDTEEPGKEVTEKTTRKRTPAKKTTSKAKTEEVAEEPTE